MDLLALKKKHVRETLKIGDVHGKVFAYIDFGNVNHWYSEDRQAADGRILNDNEKLVIDLSGLKQFADCIAEDVRFYYGLDPSNPGSMGFIRAARDIYGKHRVFTKQMQKIRHYLSVDETATNTRATHSDGEGTYILIPKCNFDVEIAVDAIKLAEHYDTFCLFSSDADFVHLARYLKSKGKKVILIKGGHVVRQLREVADLVISAQDIKLHISLLKQKPGR